MKIGLLTDIHFAERDMRYNRYYRDSQAKLEAAMAAFREEDVDFVVQLGDLVDGGENDRAYLHHLRNLLQQCGAPVHHVLGNHDTHFLRKNETADILETRVGNYAFDFGDWHFVVLDACYRADHVSYAPYNYEWTDCALPPAQIEWLRADLAASEKPVIVFLHQRLDLPVQHLYAVGNNPAVREVLEACGKVRAVFQGHTHKNELACIKGIPYCTLRGLVEGPGMANNAYGILNFSEWNLRLTGFGAQSDYSLPFTS